MFPHIFRPSAEKDLSKLSSNIRARIVKKLEFYLLQDNPLIFAEPLISPKIGDYRFRVGSY